MGQMEAKSHRSAGQRGQVGRFRPAYRVQCPVGGDGQAAILREAFKRLPVAVEDLDAQFAAGRIGVDEQVLAAEGHRPGGQHAGLIDGVHRDEPVAPQDRQAGRGGLT